MGRLRLGSGLGRFLAGSGRLFLRGLGLRLARGCLPLQQLQLLLQRTHLLLDRFHSRGVLRGRGRGGHQRHSHSAYDRKAIS